MAEKEGLNLSPKSIGLIIVVLLAAGGGTVGGVNLSRGASTEASEGIRVLVEAEIDKRESTMTLEEAETWRKKVDRQEHVDETLQEHGKELVQLRTEVRQVQTTVDAIAHKVGASDAID